MIRGIDAVAFGLTPGYIPEGTGTITIEFEDFAKSWRTCR